MKCLTRIFLRIFQALPVCHGMPRQFMKCQISPDAYDHKLLYTVIYATTYIQGGP